jgi:branched-chain amino acid transport system ATP-binding protein
VRQDIAKALLEVRSAGITSIIVEQNAVAALQLSDRSVILDSGEVVYDGSAQDVLDNEELRLKYLAI